MILRFGDRQVEVKKASSLTTSVKVQSGEGSNRMVAELYLTPAECKTLATAIVEVAKS